MNAIIAVALFMLLWALLEYVLPRPSALAKIYNVKRRHLEGHGTWERRAALAAENLSRTCDAFLDVAARHGAYTPISARGGTWSLSYRYPEAVAFLAAKYPDGPPYEVLCEVAGIELRRVPRKLRVVQ